MGVQAIPKRRRGATLMADDRPMWVKPILREGISGHEIIMLSDESFADGVAMIKRTAA